MKIIINKILPFGKKFYAINICGILLAKGHCGPITINHESIHTRQIKELLYLFFYLFYFIEWVLRIIQYRNNYKAYLNISFEREAYSNERNLKYLSQRRPYSFIKYFKILPTKKGEP